MENHSKKIEQDVDTAVHMAGLVHFTTIYRSLWNFAFFFSFFGIRSIVFYTDIILSGEKVHMLTWIKIQCSGMLLS